MLSTVGVDVQPRTLMVFLIRILIIRVFLIRKVLILRIFLIGKELVTMQVLTL